MQTKNKHQKKVDLAQQLIGGRTSITIEGKKYKASIFGNSIWQSHKVAVAARVARKQAAAHARALARRGIAERNQPTWWTRLVLWLKLKFA